MSFLFRSFVHEMRHKRLLYGDKSSTWHSYENDAIEFFPVPCGFNFWLAFDAVSGEDKVKNDKFVLPEKTTTRRLERYFSR
jgi:hypothetical protein